MVPRPPFGSHPIEELPETPPRIPRHHICQRGNDHGVSPAGRHRRPIERRPRQPHHATGLLHRQLMLADQDLGDLSLRERPYSFRFSTSLMAAFSMASSAYIRFNLAFSASSSRSRFT